MITIAYASVVGYQTSEVIRFTEIIVMLSMKDTNCHSYGLAGFILKRMNMLWTTLS